MLDIPLAGKPNCYGFHPLLLASHQIQHRALIGDWLYTADKESPKGCSGGSSTAYNLLLFHAVCHAGLVPCVFNVRLLYDVLGRDEQLVGGIDC